MKRIAVVVVATVAVIVLAMSAVYALTRADDVRAEHEPAQVQPTADVDLGTDPVDEEQQEPVYDCREIDGQEVCDTFGESDEGPGSN